MVTKDNLKKRELESLEDYFELMYVNERTGQYSEVRKKFKKLGKDQRIELFLYIAERIDGSDEDWKHLFDTCIREIYS